MGGWFSRNKTSDFKKQLEDLDRRIEEYSETRKKWQLRQRYLVSRFFFISIFIEILLIAYGYVWFYYLDHQESLDPTDPVLQYTLRIGMILVFPIFIYFTSKTISGYYNRKLRNADDTVQELQIDQVEKLRQLMEMTDFDFIQKYHQKISRRLAPQQQQRAPQPQAAPVTKARPQAKQTDKKEAKPNVQTPVAAPVKPAPTNAVPPTNTPAPTNRLPATYSMPSVPAPRQQQPPTQYSQIQPPPQTRQPSRTYVMPAVRTAPPAPVQRSQQPDQPKGWFNSMVDWLVGDGPDNSVSQICERCKSFNGTIPKDEALFNEFICFYCKHQNKKSIAMPAIPKMPSTSSASSSTTTQQRDKGDDKKRQGKEEEEEEKTHRDEHEAAEDRAHKEEEEEETNDGGEREQEQEQGREEQDQETRENGDPKEEEQGEEIVEKDEKEKKDD